MLRRRTEPLGKFLPKAKDQPYSPPDPEEEKRSSRTAAYIAGGVLAAGGLLAYQQHGILQRAAKNAASSLKREKGLANRRAVKAAEEAYRVPKTTKDAHRSILEETIAKRRLDIDFPAASDERYTAHVDRLLKHVHGPIPEADKILASHPTKEAQRQIHAIKVGRINKLVNTMAVGKTDRLAEGAARDVFHKEVVTPIFKAHNLPVNLKNLSGLPKEEAERIQRHVYSKKHAAMIDPVNPPDTEVLKAQSAGRKSAAQQKRGRKSPIKTPGQRDKRGADYGDYSVGRFRKDLETAANEKITGKKKKRPAFSAPGAETESAPRPMANPNEPVPVIYGNKPIPPKSTPPKSTTPKSKAPKKDHTPPSWKKPKELSRLVNLIMLESTQVRNNNGTFGSGDQPMTDPRTMQYAYHRPNAQGGFDHNMNGQKRGRGRPPGSLNRRTLASREVEEAAIAQQPEAKRGLGLGTKALIGAGILGGAGLVIGPKVAPGFRASRRASMAVERIGGRIGDPVTKAGTAAGWSKAVFGERLAKKAAKTGESVEDLIVNRVQNISRLREERLAGKGYPKPDEITGITPWPRSKEQRKTDKAVAGLDAATANLRQSKAENKLILQHQKVTSKLQKKLTAAEKRIAQSEATGPKLGEANEEIKSLKEQLEGSAAVPTKKQSVTEAKKILRTSTTGPAQARTEQGGKALKQDELFVSATVPSTPLGGKEYLREVEDTKQRLMANRKAEFDALSKAHGIPADHFATAMAERQIKGKYTRYAPAPEVPKQLVKTSDGSYKMVRPPQHDIDKYERTKKQLKEGLIETDQEVKDRITTKSKEAFDSAVDRFNSKIKGGNIKMNKRLETKRTEIAADAAAKARLAEMTQLVSEKKLHPSTLRRVTVAGRSGKASARELAFARRLRQRIELSRTTSSSFALHPGMIELGVPVPLFPNEEKRRNWGEVGKDAAIGGVASAVGTAGLLYGAAKVFGKKAPDLSKMLKTASGQHLRVFNPMTTVPMMRSLPEASRIFGKQLRAVSSAEAMAASGKQPTVKKITQAFKESGLGPQDPKDIAAFHKKWGRTPGETMEKSVGLLSGMAATGVGAGVGAALSPGLKKKKREELSALRPGMIRL